MASNSTLEGCAALRIPILPENSPRLTTPATFRIPLLPHQERSLSRMVQVEQDGRLLDSDFGTHIGYTSNGGCLADKIGMGKTATVLALIAQEVESDFHGPTLVIAPAHLLRQWKNEAAKFVQADALRVYLGLDELRAAQKVVNELGRRSLLNNRALVLVDVKECLGAPNVEYSLGPCRNGRLGPIVSSPGWSDADLAKARSIACSIAKGYSGKIYEGPLHSMRAARAPDGLAWRRVVFEEVQDLVASGKQAQDNFLQLTSASRNVWLVTATPFPRGDDSIYANGQLLGFKRLRLHVVGGGAPPSNHPFELIKKRLYVRNSETAVRAALAAIVGRVVEEHVEVALLPLEALLCDACAADAAAEAGLPAAAADSSSSSAAVWSSHYVSARACVSTPFACPDFQEALTPKQTREGAPPAPPATAVSLASTGGVAWLASQVSRFVSGRAKDLSGRVFSGATELSAAKCGLAVAHQLLADRAKGRTVTSSLTDLALNKLCATVDAHPDPGAHGEGGIVDGCGVRVRGLSANVAAMRSQSSANVDPVLVGAESVRRYFSVYAHNDSLLERYVVVTSNFISDKAAALARQRVDLARATSSSSSLAQTVQENSGAIARAGSSSSSSSNSSVIAMRWGSKLAALLAILTRAPDTAAVPSQSSSSSASSSSPVPRRKVIVFSMFSDALAVCSLMLKSETVPHAAIHGASNTATMKAQALARFSGGAGGGAGGEVDVLLLSSAASASGANLQAASVVVFLDPPGTGSALDGASLERQAVGRAVRMGQLNAVVTVIRLCATGTLERELWRGIRAAAAEEEAREQSPQTAAYVVERAGASATAEAATEAASRLEAEKEAKDDGILGCVQVTVADAVAAKFAAVAAAGDIIEITDDTDDEDRVAEPVKCSSDNSGKKTYAQDGGVGADIKVKVETLDACHRNEGVQDTNVEGLKRSSSPESTSRPGIMTRSKCARNS